MPGAGVPCRVRLRSTSRRRGFATEAWHLLKVSFGIVTQARGGTEALSLIIWTGLSSGFVGQNHPLGPPPGLLCSFVVNRLKASTTEDTKVHKGMTWESGGLAGICGGAVYQFGAGPGVADAVDHCDGG